MQLWINGIQVQKGDAELMIHKPQAIIDEIQSFSTLRDDDIVMSGSPEGVGPYSKGDHFVGKILVRGKELTSDEWIAE
jgi:2-keto-4-pentenoate hydratase/2-oxohepta-3-ene-1,7-dioic acid hydratase in catechol pathway